MKILILLASAFLSFLMPSLKGADSTFQNYQNYNHGYCPECNCARCVCENPLQPPPQAAPVPDPCGCNAPSPPPAPCDPCAPVCGAECGISLCAIAVGAAAAAVAFSLIFLAGDGSSNSHG